MGQRPDHRGHVEDCWQLLVTVMQMKGKIPYLLSAPVSRLMNRVMVRDRKILDTPWQWPSGQTVEIWDALLMWVLLMLYSLSQQPPRPAQCLGCHPRDCQQSHHMFRAVAGYFCFCSLLFCFDTGSDYIALPGLELTV